MGDKDKKGLWRCAVRGCDYECPESELKIDSRYNCQTCPKCGSEDVFPSDDDWPTDEEFDALRRQRLIDDEDHDD